MRKKWISAVMAAAMLSAISAVSVPAYAEESAEPAETTAAAKAQENGEVSEAKYVSEQMMRLQAHGFKWEDKPLQVLTQEYPNCKTALQWWCNHLHKCGTVHHIFARLAVILLQSQIDTKHME